MPYISHQLASLLSSLHAFTSAGEDYDTNVLSSPTVLFTFGNTGPMPRSVNILDDLVLEPTESFNLSLSTSSPDCSIPNPLVPVTIMDDGEQYYSYSHRRVNSYHHALFNLQCVELQCVY